MSRRRGPPLPVREVVSCRPRRFSLTTPFMLPISPTASSVISSRWWMAGTWSTGILAPPSAAGMAAASRSITSAATTPATMTAPSPMFPLTTFHLNTPPAAGGISGFPPSKWRPAAFATPSWTLCPGGRWIGNPPWKACPPPLAPPVKPPPWKSPWPTPPPA